MSPVPSKKARRAPRLGAARAHVSTRPAVCWQPRSTRHAPFSLKQQRCPYCGCAESLNRHSKLYGNDPAAAHGQVLRGQRVFCSNRGQRGGCGRTFCLFLAQVLPRHTVTTAGLWQLLCRLLAGASLKAGAEALRLPFGLDTLYHLLQRLRQRLPEVRSLLCREQKPPASSQTDALLQTVEHLRAVFGQSPCPLAAFQFHFQRSFLG